MRDLRLQRFGRLLSICPTKRQGRGKPIIWLCRCDCGNLKEVKSKELLSGNTKSCGCLMKEKTRQRLITHGDTINRKGTRLYNIWINMKVRCSIPIAPDYKYYGKRGVSVYSEWVNNYQAFKFWALLSGYQNNLTIDRINNNGDYEPDNCQWLTLSENSKKGWKERRERQ